MILIEFLLSSVFVLFFFFCFCFVIFFLIFKLFKIFQLRIAETILLFFSPFFHIFVFSFILGQNELHIWHILSDKLSVQYCFLSYYCWPLVLQKQSLSCLAKAHSSRHGITTPEPRFDRPRPIRSITGSEINTKYQIRTSRQKGGGEWVYKKNRKFTLHQSWAWRTTDALIINIRVLPLQDRTLMRNILLRHKSQAAFSFFLSVSLDQSGTNKLDPNNSLHK